jgi:2',3'-cyclic-nucleotide 2'-phosphodiesterase (5'-nucleotidase family)
MARRRRDRDELPHRARHEHVLLAALGLALAACRGREVAPGPRQSAEAGAPRATTTDEPPPRGKVISLVYTSNVGGEYERCGCAVTPIGGLARRAAEVDRIRGESDGVLQVDAGDLFLPRGDEVEAQRTGLRPPTPGEVERRARLIAAAYARLGVAAFTPGERDLALGVPLLRRVLADAEIPVVSANLVDTRGELLFPADRLVEVSGVKVGIFGVTGGDLLARVPAGVHAREPAAAARAEVESLRARGARLVVALVHVGDRSATKAFLARTPGIDWAALGHDKRKLDTPELAETGARSLEAMELGRFLGRLDLHLVSADAKAPFADRDARAQRAAILASHERTLAEAERSPPLDANASLDAYLVGLRKRVADEARDLRALPATVTGNWFENRVVALDTAVPDQIGVAALVSAYNAESDRLVAAGKRVGVAPFVRGAAAPPAHVGQADDAKPPAATYLGAAACARCHAPETAFWRTTKHARGLAALEAAHAAKSLACVGCHVTGFAQPGGAADLATVTTRLRDVGCEACHGPGSAHVDAPRDPRAIARRVPASVCLGCHTPDRTRGAFDYNALLGAILSPGHGVPAN